MVCTKFHRIINAFYRSNTFCINADCFINHRDKNPIYNKACCFVYLYRGLSDFFGNSFDFFYYFIRGIQSCNHFHKLHNRSRVEEMHTNYRTIQPCADFRNGKGRSIRCKDTVFFANILQFFKSLFLNIHNFKGSFYNQITVCADCLYARCNLCKESVCFFLIHFPFCDTFFKTFCNFVFAVCRKFFINVTKEYFISFCLGKCLCNTGTHCAGANNSYFHTRSS